MYIYPQQKEEKTRKMVGKARRFVLSLRRHEKSLSVKLNSLNIL